MTFRNILLRANWFLSAQLGLDLRVMIRSLRGMPKFLLDVYKFRSKYKGSIEYVPCLHDWYEEGGATKNEYFWQDLVVARMIFNENPDNHVDIGSRVDGFVAHVASFRSIEVFDVRAHTTQIPGVIFRQADLMNAAGLELEYCDSLSCLHALEHFGLGRYGDPIDPNGFERGLVNMASLIKKGGVFYLSVPIGIERVEFNANRVFDPRTIITLAVENSLSLLDLFTISHEGVTEKIDTHESNLVRLTEQRYALCLFVFIKVS